MQAVVARKRRFESDASFHRFNGRDVYKADFDDGFILNVVDEEKGGSLRLTLMLAGRIADFTSPDVSSVWSERALKAVRQLVEARLKDFSR